MEAIRSYVLSVCGAGIFCAIVRQMLPEKGSATALCNLLGGVIMTFAILSPLQNISLQDISTALPGFSADGASVTAMGQELSYDAFAGIIKQEAEAYILDKATALGAEISVEVSLSVDAVPVPESVVITGEMSPYVKSVLSVYLLEELGIAKERQIWIGAF